MEYEWDDSKQTSNLLKHKIGFDNVAHLNWSKAVIVDRTRHVDQESRYAGIGLIGSRLYTVIFTWREDRMRIISFRRANTTEENIYEKNT